MKIQNTDSFSAGDWKKLKKHEWLYLVLLNTVSLFLLSKILVWNGFYGSFEEFFRLQRTLILYPGNIPEFVMSEDILSLKEVSSYLGTATDFYPNKSCKSLNIMVPGAED